MAITNKIICSSTYREEDYSSMMLCEYEVISNSPFKVSAVLVLLQGAVLFEYIEVD